MKYGIWIVNNGKLDPKQVIESAVKAEEAGWDGVFVSDCFSEGGGYSDPMILLAGIATRTKTIKLGTWVVPIPRRQPWQLALDLATLDHLSNGRVIFGAGLGVPEDFTWFGQRSDGKERAEKFNEGLEVIQGLWSGETFSYEGKHFNVKDAKLPLIPIQKPRIPILLAGYWPKKRPFDRGAKWDGMMPFWNEYPEPLSDESLGEMINYYNERSNSLGEFVIPFPGDISELTNEIIAKYQKIGVTWLLATDLRMEDRVTPNLDKIVAGPPNQ